MLASLPAKSCLARKIGLSAGNIIKTGFAVIGVAVRIFMEGDEFMDAYANILPGDPAPWFHQRSMATPRYAFDTAAGTIPRPLPLRIGLACREQSRNSGSISKIGRV
ncbi:hypothetical protein [Rhizobium sp. NXC14]|uniref:hypothetical protein n=1 Tax=Rhizobium sp. NXC14 TaxID=1981173 RepID=UPI001FDA7D2D|nr:hypothetical protein [Rhizobium sp. NXC14]